MSSFNCINQYDQSITQSALFNKTKNSCHLFALYTARSFMKTGDISKEEHELNVRKAVETCVNYGLFDSLCFDDVVQYSSLDIDDVMSTTSELIKQNIVGYVQILPDMDKYATVILKNGRYIVVMYDGVYHVRDCHETTQYDFDDRNILMEFLNEKYQFDKMIDLDGYTVPEFSSVEFLVVYSEFLLHLP